MTCLRPAAALIALAGLVTAGLLRGRVDAQQPPAGSTQILFDGEPTGVTLWGVRNTAPYFHDGSAKTLDEVVEQYQFFFKDNPFGLITTLTEQDKKDIAEYPEAPLTCVEPACYRTRPVDRHEAGGGP